MKNTSERSTALRLGGWLAITGTVLSVVVNALHPHQDIPTDEFMTEVHETTFWIPLHLGIVIAQVIDMLAMLAIGRSLRGVVRGDLVRYADGAAVLAAAVMLTLMAQDGFTAKHLADYYETAQGQAQAMAYPVAYAFLLLLLAGLGLWYLVFFGVAMPLYSLAMFGSALYPRWLALLGVSAGVASFVVGSLIYTLGASFLVTTVLFLVFSSLGFVWLFTAGVHMLRGAGRNAEEAVSTEVGAP
ncbi:hypothetical protein [Nocardiopsis alborubida]|uniref:DUF4386 family protein n=1 Tax=Nocardiopsis alborubida TaxID=146802 RepID=A0A7X6MA45_9ACTN|nr:hypothetical protein [Nocardiopsis alborubida]NKY97199.1 hypothetical protein [Nocardiopsis alborubida]